MVRYFQIDGKVAIAALAKAFPCAKCAKGKEANLRQALAGLKER